MPWGVAAAGIGAAGTIGGSLLQSGAAGKAAGQAQHNLEMVVPQLQQNYNTAVGGFQPYQAGGAASTADMQDLLGLNGQDAANAAMAKFQSSPGYQFQMQQGLRGVDAGAAAQGMLRSGATLKAEDTFAQGLANTDFGQYYNRLSGLAGQGLTAAGGIATAGNNLGAGLEGNAQSQATTAIGAGNAQSSIYGNAASGLGNIANNLFSNKNFQSWAGGLFGGGSSFNPAGGLTGTAGTSAGFGDQPVPVRGRVLSVRRANIVGA